MKRKKSSTAICGIVVLLGIGYLIPTMVMHIKDWSLKNEQKDVSIEAIQIDSQKVDLLEELSVFPDMLSNQFLVEVGGGFETNYTEAMQQAEDSFSKELYTSVQEFLMMLDVKQKVVLEIFYAQNYAMMADVNDERVYSIWVCKGADSSGKEYYFWVDATLQKVMAFDVPYAIYGKSDEAFYSAMHRLVAYYDFSAYDSFAYTYFSEPTELAKTEYWKTDLQILDKPGKVILSLSLYKNADRFSFNIYPGTVKISNNMQYDKD